ncbi:hypothetical protein [Nostoc sp. TCL26-01]|uniref:hypothetical protein n=1 Tax=Nostoc sp. TCL26-01 TaxID=2576904 RepID=UPI0015BFFD15|nr:hypothetical protein [Nostoc sp. TCL26-01]QLE54521.1 hypothetical protein FD725_02725 [Nostoc sp. TCL26-01]
MPFTKLSCQQQEIITLNGVQLATGTSVKQPSLGGRGTKGQKIPGEPLAVMAIVASLVGLGTSFIKAKRSAIAPDGSRGISLILLLTLKSKIDDGIVKKGQGLILVTYELGFCLEVLLFVSTTV